MGDRKRSRAWLICASAMALAATPAAAQDAPATDGDILVTARRVTESLQDTPIAVTALSADALELRGVQNVQDLGAFTPNLNIVNSTGIGGSRTAFAFIRGIGQPEVFVQNDPGVGIYVDGVYLGRTQGALMEVLDLERVEVLRGPQGTLYGRNTIGGAINLISARPGNTLRADASVEAGNYDTINARASVGGPLSGTVAASISIASLNHDGYVRARPEAVCGGCAREGLSDEDTLAGRFALRITPADTFTIDLSVDGSRRRALPIARRLVMWNPAFDPFGYTPAVQAKWGVPITDFVNPVPNTHSSIFAGKDNQDVWGAAATLTWEVGNVRLQSVTGYRELKTDHASDGDGTPAMINTVKSETLSQHQLSQELQASGSGFGDRLDWVAGLFGYTEHANSNVIQAKRFAESGIFIPGVPPTIIDCFRTTNPLNSCPDEPPLPSALKVDNLAAYGNLTWHLTSRFSLSGGLRYSWEEKRFRGFDPFGVPLNLKDSWESITPRIGAEFKPSDDVLVYGSYSEGFKSGTFNNGNDPFQPRRVEPEEVSAYELGLKTQWFGRRLTLNGAVFWNDYRGQQLQVPTSAFTFAFVNVASSRIYGAELEMQARISRALSIDGSVGWLDTKITDVDVATPGVVKGAKLVRTPAFSSNLGATLDVPVAGWGSVIARADWSHKSSTEGDFTNNPNVRTRAYDVVNLRAGLRFAKRWEVSAWVRNLFDKKYEVARSSVDPNLFAVAVDGTPRTYGLRLGFRY